MFYVIEYITPVNSIASYSSRMVPLTILVYEHTICILNGYDILNRTSEP